MGLACHLSNHLGNLSRVKVVTRPFFRGCSQSIYPRHQKATPLPDFCRSTVRRSSLVDNDVVIAETGRWQEVGLPMRAQVAIQYLTLTLQASCFLAFLSPVRVYKPLRDHSLCVLIKIRFSPLARLLPSLSKRLTSITMVP